MEDKLSNSNKSRERALAAPSDKPTAIIKKKSGFSTFISSFIPYDAGNMREYILGDVLIPLVKKAIVDTVDTLLYPNGGSPRDKKSKVSYRSFYDNRDARRSASRRDYRRSNMDTYSIIIPDRGMAERILKDMDDLLRDYDVVSIQDYKELLQEYLDIPGMIMEYTDNDWGWTDLSGTNVVRIRNGSGFEIDLPRPISIK